MHFLIASLQSVAEQSNGILELRCVVHLIYIRYYHSNRPNSIVTCDLAIMPTTSKSLHSTGIALPFPTARSTDKSAPIVYEAIFNINQHTCSSVLHTIAFTAPFPISTTLPFSLLAPSFSLFSTSTPKHAHLSPTAALSSTLRSPIPPLNTMASTAVDPPSLRK